MSLAETVRNETLGFQQEIARLQALLEASRRVHGALDLDAVLHCVLEIAVKELEADGAFFTEGEALISARSTCYGRIPESAHGDPQEDWASYPNVDLFDKRGRLLTRLVVLRPGNPLSLEEQDFLEGLALQSAVAVENARHHKRLLAWERVQQDLAAARAIQHSLLPQALPAIPGYALDYRSKTCFEVGGDYVDILALPEPDCGALLDCLWRQLAEFGGDTEQSDDMTALALLRRDRETV
jgi:hypothetical protein